MPQNQKMFINNKEKWGDNVKNIAISVDDAFQRPDVIKKIEEFQY